jgi:uncharacterized protein
MSLISNTKIFSKRTLTNAETGHNWWHALRVRNNALLILEHEKCNANKHIVEIASLLHDIADRKINNGDEKAGLKKIESFLTSQNLSIQQIQHTLQIIKNISFSKEPEPDFKLSIEGKIVQDADRLDAIGAIGIARAFNYGGHKSRELYLPDINIKGFSNLEDYKTNSNPTINHFYEKLLLLKDLMNTKTGKILANSRHNYMLSFLDQFYAEWNGNTTEELE